MHELGAAARASWSADARQAENSGKVPCVECLCSEDFQLILLCNDKWTEGWYRELVLPFSSRYHNLPLEQITFFDMTQYSGNDSFGSLFDALLALIMRFKQRAKVFGCTDVSIELYSAVLAELRNQANSGNTEVAAFVNNLTGAHFLCCQLAANKLACRKLVDGCDSIQAEGVYSNDEFLPQLVKDEKLLTGFFKPLAECGSKGVFKVDENLQVSNPLKGTTNPFTRFPTKVKELLLGPGANKETAEEDTVHVQFQTELFPYFSENLVGIVEEYCPPTKTRRAVSIDGFIDDRGEIFHYSISDNVYKEDAPEVFDCLSTPARSIDSGLETKLWALYDKVAQDFVRRGVRGQFFDVETFIFQNYHGATEVGVIEVNCRTFSNMLPIMGWVYGDRLRKVLEREERKFDSVIEPIADSFSSSSSDHLSTVASSDEELASLTTPGSSSKRRAAVGDMFSSAVDLLRQNQMSVQSRDRPSSAHCSTQLDKTVRRVGVCAYAEPNSNVKGAASVERKTYKLNNENSSHQQSTEGLNLTLIPQQRPGMHRTCMRYARPQWELMTMRTKSMRSCSLKRERCATGCSQM
jgi:hypothetical protein